MKRTLSRGTITNVYTIEVQTFPIVVHEHKESQAKYIAFPFTFPDGYPATLVLTKGTRGKWIPKDEIERILIEFK